MGRQPSATRNQWQAFAHHCLTGGIEKFRREMDKLEGKDYVYAFLQALKYVKPQLATVRLTDEEGNKLMQPIINVIQLPGQDPQVLNRPNINIEPIEKFEELEEENSDRANIEPEKPEADEPEIS